MSGGTTTGPPEGLNPEALNSTLPGTACQVGGIQRAVYHLFRLLSVNIEGRFCEAGFRGQDVVLENSRRGYIPVG
jgi:hypothetical protein